MVQGQSNVHAATECSAGSLHSRAKVSLNLLQSPDLWWLWWRRRQNLCCRGNQRTKSWGNHACVHVWCQFSRSLKSTHQFVILFTIFLSCFLFCANKVFFFFVLLLMPFSFLFLSLLLVFSLLLLKHFFSMVIKANDTKQWTDIFDFQYSYSD